MTDTKRERELTERIREGYVRAHEAGGHARYGNVEGCPLCETTRITQLEAEIERVQRCAVCGTGQLHRRLTDDEALVAQRIYDADAAADRALAEVERLREDIATGPDWGEQYLREMDERKRQGDRAHKWQTRADHYRAGLEHIAKTWAEGNGAGPAAKRVLETAPAQTGGGD